LGTADRKQCCCALAVHYNERNMRGTHKHCVCVCVCVKQSDHNDTPTGAAGQES